MPAANAVGSLLAVVAVGAAVWYASTSHGPDAATPGSCDDALDRPKFAVILDAGSTGSRVHVYVFSAADRAKGNARDLTKEHFLEVKPGLSSFKGDTAAAARSLDPLMHVAEANVPAADRRCTSMELKATAGLRLLGEVQAQALLDAAAHRMRQTGFRVSQEGAAVVMSGVDEGVFGWLTVNFLIGRLGGDKTKSQETAAIMDMGGASTQIVFAPAERDLAWLEGEDRFDVDFLPKLLPAPGGVALYQHSHLRYGLMVAGEEIMNRAQAAATRAADSPTKSPCAFAIAGGAPDFSSCLEHAVAYLNKSVPCGRAGSCSVNGAAQPALEPSSSPNAPPVYVFSYFFDRIEPFLPSSGDITVQDYRVAGQAVCGDAQGVYASQVRGRWCADLAYLYALLHVGYGLPDGARLRAVKQISGFEVAWTVGAALRFI